MTKDLFLKMKAYAIAKNKLESYVVLKEDERGRYIEWAFKDGAPHDNRCLSWYDSWQPKALERNGHDLDAWKNRLKPVGCIYELNEFACNRAKKEGEEHCSAGHPCKKCFTTRTYNWTYEEPVKCACWYLEKIDYNAFSDAIEKAAKLIDAYNKLVNDEKNNK